jgi:hypothetical protein
MLLVTQFSASGCHCLSFRCKYSPHALSLSTRNLSQMLDLNRNRIIHCYLFLPCVATDDNLCFIFEIFRIIPGRQYVFVLLRDLWLKPVINELILLFRTES